MIAAPVWQVPWAWAADLCVLAVAAYCLSKTIADFRQQRFLFGAAGLACTAFLALCFLGIMFAEVSP